MIFKIKSSNTSASGLNIVPWIAENGVQWTRNGIESPDAGRTLDMTMHRGLLGFKAKAEVACVWMNQADVATLLNAIAPETVTVTTDTLPWTTSTVTMTMYSNNNKGTILTEYTDGTKLYGDVVFPLVEV